MSTDFLKVLNEHFSKRNSESNKKSSEPNAIYKRTANGSNATFHKWLFLCP